MKTTLLIPAGLACFLLATPALAATDVSGAAARFQHCGSRGSRYKDANE